MSIAASTALPHSTSTSACGTTAGESDATSRRARYAAIRFTSSQACAPTGPERWFDSEGTLNHSAPSDLDTYPLSDTQMRSDDAGRDFPASAGDPATVYVAIAAARHTQPNIGQEARVIIAAVAARIRDRAADTKRESWIFRAVPIVGLTHAAHGGDRPRRNDHSPWPGGFGSHPRCTPGVHEGWCARGVRDWTPSALAHTCCAGQRPQWIRDMR